MNYKDILVKAGYPVKYYEEFGSYQGNWAAILEDGGVILGYFGSCSGCDAYKAYRDHRDHIFYKFMDLLGSLINKEAACTWWYNDPPLSQHECEEFCRNEEYEAIYDYDRLFQHEKWDSDSCERASWIKEKLITMGLLYAE